MWVCESEILEVSVPNVLNFPHSQRVGLTAHHPNTALACFGLAALGVRIFLWGLPMRARNIKPGFFKNEELSECSFPARLLFPGLWMLADREGRLEYRPKRIKAEIFPFDSVDVAALISELVTHGLVKVYSVDGASYLWIVKFTEHQRPHQNESASTIPCYSSTEEVIELFGEALATKVQSACDQGGKHFALNPSSLIPSSQSLEYTDNSLLEPSGAKQPKTAKQPKEDRPSACPPEEWKKYLQYSRGFHTDKANQLGARAPLTDAKVLDGAKALDNLIRIKGRPEDEVLAVLGWSIDDPFWSTNLRSIKALLKTSSSNGELKYSNVLTAMDRDMERKAERSMAGNG